MKERPIPFNTHEVRATLDGRKSQFRRVIKHRQVLDWLCDTTITPACAPEWCQYQPGDRLWVRETWKRGIAIYGNQSVDVAQYRATPGVHDEADDEVKRAGWESRWRPSIHMPRWASRITLEVTGVRVERLQEISEEDAVAEGFGPATLTIGARDRFFETWCQLYGGRPAWDSNPWVWVVEFRRVQS